MNRCMLRREILAACVMSAVAIGCRDSTLPHAAVSVSDSASIRSANAQLQTLNEPIDRQCSVSGQPPTGTCSVTYTATPANYFCDGDGCVLLPPQQDPITGTFSKPVYRLIVQMNGQFYCSGNYGTVAMFNRAGTQVEELTFTLSDPADCGEDNITCCAMDTIQFSGGIGHTFITPPQPGGDIVVGYTFWFDSTRAPTVDSCLTGDELLDQQAMREFLGAAWDSSHTTEPPGSRRETPGYLFEDSTGSLLYRLYQSPATDTPCSSSLPLLSSLPDVPLASGHTHPFAPLDTLLPPLCGLRTPRVYDTVTYGGASDLDITALTSDSLPFYILDKNNIYAYPALGVTLLNAKSMVRTYPRVDPVTGCGRL